ncbi:GntR family transcriptional regulator [Geodermatophilus sp. DF01_2]|uniref:FadR/GntR family transcriptional regulator n=1 Tax=Geodermatophilus sp. DF01-2 TaxID=2559610 RepID=UPI001431482A|nr:GntR family transcriptional regulator [Geodermatophilus sp. DF01_2]
MTLDEGLHRPYVRPVRRAYEQVADQIRQWILSGALSPGDRLPTEEALSERFGTSRGTVREALRLLSSEDLIVTRPGGGGGSTVSHPNPTRITDSLRVSLSLLVGVSGLSSGELVQAREIMEVPGAALAAEHRAADHLATLSTLLPEHPEQLDPDHLFEIDRAFHETLLRASGNRLLPLIASSVYEVNARRVQRNRVAPGFWRLVVDQHRDIYQAVLASDAAAAARAMTLHLQELARLYDYMDSRLKSDAAPADVPEPVTHD